MKEDFLCTERMNSYRTKIDTVLANNSTTVKKDNGNLTSVYGKKTLPEPLKKGNIKSLAKARDNFFA